MEEPGLRTGPQLLASRLRYLRHEKQLTQEELAERASLLDASLSVSVETVRQLESKLGRKLPSRRASKGKFAIELIAMALDVKIEDLLVECFSDNELAPSCFAWAIEHRRSRQVKLRNVRNADLGLADFIDSLPFSIEELLNFPGVLQLKNARAFAYIFALEKSMPALEMSVLNEPPVIFLDKEGILGWGRGMGLSGVDFDTFTEYVSSCRAHSRNLALKGLKRFKIVLIKKSLYLCLAKKERLIARAIVEDMIYMLTSAPRMEMVILDLPETPDEIEVISAHGEIPSSLDSTVSIVIRQTSMSAINVEYSIVPMPPTFSGLQRDISKIDRYWSLALDQYSNFDHADFWPNPNKATILHLRALIAALS